MAAGTKARGFLAFVSGKCPAPWPPGGPRCGGRGRYADLATLKATSLFGFTFFAVIMESPPRDLPVVHWITSRSRRHVPLGCNGCPGTTVGATTGFGRRGERRTTG